MIYVVVNSSKIELPTGKMYFSDLRGHRSVARPSCAIQVLERMNRVPGNIIPVTSDWFGTQCPGSIIPQQDHIGAMEMTPLLNDALPRTDLVEISKGL